MGEHKFAALVHTIGLEEDAKKQGIRVRENDPKVGQLTRKLQAARSLSLSKSAVVQVKPQPSEGTQHKHEAFLHPNM